MFHGRLVPVCVVWFIAASASAQDVEWRRDYGRARQEATEKNLPLLINIGTTECFWCKQLDGRTFKDAAVSGLLNGQFVPLKVDGNRERGLVEALQVQSYPTLVIATPTGKIVNTQVGFLDAERFQAFLRNTLAQMPAKPATAATTATVPSWMNDDCDAAAKAIEKGDYCKAIPCLRRVVKDDQKLPVQARAVALLKQVEDQAAAMLARIKELGAAGKAFDAVNEAQDLVKYFDGTPAAAEATALLPGLNAKLDEATKKRIVVARELLGQAREDFRTEQYLICLLRCESLAARYAELAEAADARALADQIKNNAVWMQQICDALPDLNGTSYLTMADAMLKNGQPQQAVFYLERVLQTFPNGRQAELAQAKLAQLQGPPPLPSEEEKK